MATEESRIRTVPGIEKLVKFQIHLQLTQLIPYYNLNKSVKQEHMLQIVSRWIKQIEKAEHGDGRPGWVGTTEHWSQICTFLN